jgi:tRNA uridine 5-carboxymethylaminomethyl modification enzyme
LSCQYSALLQKQQREIEQFRKNEHLKFPTNIEWKKLSFLSNEEKEKLTLVKPPTLGAASRVSGVTPASLVRLLYYIQKESKSNIKQQHQQA